MERYEDTLSLVGTVAGVFLVLVGLGTVVGTPWATQGIAASILQVVGALFAVAIGAGLAWFTRTGDVPV